MLKRLRFRLTFITMSLVTAVLLSVMATMMISNYSRNVRSTKNALTRAISGNPGPGREGHHEPREGEGAGEGEAYPTEEFGIRNDKKHDNDGSFTPTMVVTVSADGQITVVKSRLGTISSENLEAVVKTALASSESEGLIRDYALRFLKQTEADGTVRIAFADRSHETGQLQSLLLTSLAIGLPALALLFGISLFLSGLAVKPVKTSLDQQKQFIADASHELKTPLTVILTNNEIMARHPDDTVASQQEWIESTREEGGRRARRLPQGVK